MHVLILINKPRLKSQFCVLFLYCIMLFCFSWHTPKPGQAWPQSWHDPTFCLKIGLALNFDLASNFGLVPNFAYLKILASNFKFSLFLTFF